VEEVEEKEGRTWSIVGGNGAGPRFLGETACNALIIRHLE
jgi:hypothetical protein